MQKRYRLKNSASFSYVYKKGRAAKGALMGMYTVPASNLKVGVSVSKKVGNSVVRSKVKRRISEAFRLLIPRVDARSNFVINAYPPAKDAAYAELSCEVETLLKRLGKLQK